MMIPATDAPGGECYRCGYDLRGIADDHPCPECGLLAARSRRPTDELHNTRPRWLRSISLGTKLVLLSLFLALIWPFVFAPIIQQVLPDWFTMDNFPFGYSIPALVFLFGVFLLTRREGYDPADRADRRLRFWLRCAAFIPLLVFVIIDFPLESLALYSATDLTFLYVIMGWTGALLMQFGTSPLALLLFIYLRRIAHRARSAHLAEHCLIVGIGTSASILYISGMEILFEHSRAWGLGDNWANNGTLSLYLALAAAVAAILFILWSIYLLVRFAIAFRKASRALRYQWSRDDRSVSAT